MNYSQVWSISWIGIPVSFFILAAAVVLVYRRRQRSEVLIFVSVSTWYYCVFYLNILLQFFPFSPDTVQFVHILAGEAGNHSATTEGFRILTTPLRVFDAGTSVYVSTSILAFSTASLLIWNTVGDVFFDKTNNGIYVYIFLICLWPAALFYITTPLREGYVILFWSVIIWSLFSKVDYRKGVIAALVSLGALYLLRPEIIPLLIMVTIFVIFGRQSSSVTISLVFSAVCIVIPVQIAKFMGIIERFSPESLYLLRGGYRPAHEQAYVSSALEWTSWLDVVADVPTLIYFFVSSPLSVDSNPFGRLLISLDAVFVILIILISIVYFLRARKLSLNMVIYLIAVVMALISFSLYEFNVTGAVRHRAPIVIMLIPIVSTYLTFKLGGLMRGVVFFRH